MRLQSCIETNVGHTQDKLETVLKADKKQRTDKQLDQLCRRVVIFDPWLFRHQTEVGGPVLQTLSGSVAPPAELIRQTALALHSPAIKSKYNKAW